MAKTKKTAGRMSRREVVMLLGTGVVFSGTVKAEDFAAEMQTECTDVKPAVGVGPNGRLVLVADTCCVDGFNVVHAGFGKAKTTGSSQDHLKTFHDVLSRAKNDGLLLEYCVMMWGLTSAQKDDLVTTMKRTYNLTDPPAPKAAK